MSGPDALDALGEDAQQWASDCALVEPISFSLAERLRVRYRDLCTPHPSLAFSRLAALTGTWTGPGGLNFEAPMRRRLLSLFACRDDTDRSKTIAIIDAAFAEVAPISGESAKVVHSYARNLVHVFADDLDAAVEEIVRIEASGLLYQSPIRDFLERLRSPQDADKSQQSLIRLPYEPRSAAVRRRLSSMAAERGQPLSLQPQSARGDSYLRSGSEISPARWSLGLPASRTRLASGDGSALPIRGHSSWGTFFFGGRHVLLAGVTDQLMVFDTLLGRVTPVELPTPSSEIGAIASAWNAPIAVISADGKCHVLRLDVESASLPATLKPAPLNTEASHRLESQSGFGRAILAVDPSGRVAFVGESGRTELLRCPIDGGERPSIWRFPAPIMALTTADNSVLVGLGNGNVHRVSVEDVENSFNDEPSFVIAGSPAAITVTRVLGIGPDGAAAPKELLIAATEEGMLGCYDRERQLSGIRYRDPVRRVVAFPDRKAVAIAGAASSAPPQITGLSVAVLGHEGSFDIVGMPIFAAAQSEGMEAAFTTMSLLNRPVLAADPLRRALAVAGQSSRVAILVDRAESGPRIEIRPLDYTLPLPAAATEFEAAALVSDIDTDGAAPGQVNLAENDTTKRDASETHSLEESSASRRSGEAEVAS
ncbi:hypothetical protein NKH24_34110 [Mesorhizobium sp. M1300]|uniref:hypothetical protein n=1 Tax=Mesorhizobium sp. M1300 TaxID=2957077 RepID=UPI0033394D3E